MPTRRSILAATLAGVALTGTPAFAAETDIRSLVDRQLPKLKGCTKVGIGAFRGRRQYAVNGDTIFQIGSITKTFTGLALAIADRAGRLSVDDHLAAHLPSRFAAPEGVTLAHLATHTSGLDRLPPGLLEDPEFDLRDPYAHFTEQKLIAALRQTTLITQPGSTYLYSNYGVGLLGWALSENYPALIRGQITKPLGLKDTTITLTDAQRRRKAQGHDETGASTPDWQMPTLAGTGALYGTVDDLLRYLRAHLGEAPPELKPALELVQRPRFTISAEMRIALGWHSFTLPTSGRTAIWHDGGTGGFTGITGFCPDRNAGVAVLVNQYGADVESIAITILDTLAR